MILRDLMDPAIHLFSEDVLLEGRVVAMDAKTGRQLFDTDVNKRKYIREFLDDEVLSIWASGKAKKDVGFGGVWFQPVTMLYLDHDRKKGENENDG